MSDDAVLPDIFVGSGGSRRGPARRRREKLHENGGIGIAAVLALFLIRRRYIARLDRRCSVGSADCQI
jgi:hypothetical protein